MHITARVTAGAKRERVKVLSPTRLAISVKEEAEQNAANKHVIELVALHFNVPISAVRILGGHHKPTKLFEVKIPNL